MKTLLYKIFVQNWQRKTIAFFLAIVVWFVVNHSLTGTKTISNIPIRIINLPQNKTVEGLQPNGVLSKKISLTLLGNEAVLDEINPGDLEVIIDASDKPDEWMVMVSKRNLVSLNPEIDVNKDISRVFHQNFTIRLTKLITEKIPVIVTSPIGDPPRDYRWLDVWPYHLNVTVHGPEEIVRHLKAKGVKLSFNLNKILRIDLDELQSSVDPDKRDEISFFVPEDWKQVSIPLLSDTPIQIDDPQAKALRIDFVRADLLPIHRPIPIQVFYPSRFTVGLNPQTCTIAPSEQVKTIHNIPHLSSENLYVKGVSSRFLSFVSDMLQINVVAVPLTERPTLEWSVQFINPQVLEDRYVASLISDALEPDGSDNDLSWKEEYLRNRFRNYMNRFRLYKPDNTKLDLKIELEGNQILIQEKSIKKS